MNRFGFSDEELKSWQDQSIFWEGKGSTAIVLIHGWTGMPRQVNVLAKELNRRGYWIFAPLLPGHGTRPEDLEKVNGSDWLEVSLKAIGEMKKRKEIKTVIVGGASMGGNLALLASQNIEVDGLILIGTPVHLRNHFSVWLGVHILSLFRDYFKKRYPKQVRREKFKMETTSYQYFPIKSVRDSLAVIRKSVFSLGKVTAPVLILQTNSDYLVAKYSPWVIYNSIGSKNKKLQWLKSENGSHILISEETPEFFSSIDNFIKEIEKNKQ